MLTEDQVRAKAETILGLGSVPHATSGVGQLTTFNQLGFVGVNYKPDGWLLPESPNEVAIILEVKRERTNIAALKCINELLRNVRIAQRKYARVVGLLYNGEDVAVYRGTEEVHALPDLQEWRYYAGLFEVKSIDKRRIFTLTKRINDLLHFKFKTNDLYDRMIFTACALVAERYGAMLNKVKGLGYEMLNHCILTTLNKSFEDAKRQNQKLDLLLKEFAGVKMNRTDDDEAIKDFIDSVVEISKSVNSDIWNGEDVMAIFFNEFNRYKPKSESGQVFTPDHITSLMYRVAGVGKNDVVLDAACGSGAFLVKSMCNMIKEAGGVRTAKAKEIKKSQLFGIENDSRIFALACANMLIHKDGKTNLAYLDSTTAEAASWIASKPITKVLMNPPFERKNHCVDIVRNVLDNVAPHTTCAFIMPDKKLEKDNGKKKLLKRHSLLKILKLPEKVFNESVNTSIFIFEAGVPQDFDKQIFACHLADDGLEAVKNQGRHDVRGKWSSIEDYWVDVLHKQHDKKYGTDQWINPRERLSYSVPEKPFKIDAGDFCRTAMDYVMFVEGLDSKETAKAISERVLYGNQVGRNCSAGFKGGKWIGCDTLGAISRWKPYVIGDLFDRLKLKVLKDGFNKRTDVSDERTDEYSLPLVNAKHGNNGIMYYGMSKDFESEEMTLDIVQNGAIATGDVYAEPQRTGVLGDAYLVKPRYEEARNTEALLFLASVLQRSIKDKFSYDDKCVWDKAKLLKVKLPTKGDEPDWSYMIRYMRNVLKRAKENLGAIKRFMR